MDKLTVMQKKIILIGLGLLILICSFFLVFQRNQDQATELDRKSTRLNSSHNNQSRMPSSA